MFQKYRAVCDFAMCKAGDFEYNQELKYQYHDWWYRRFTHMHLRVSDIISYSDVRISDERYSFEKFYDDLLCIPNSTMLGWHMDKDLLSPKNSRVYSKDTVCFIPPQINQYLVKTNQIQKRGLLRGVRVTEGRYLCKYNLDKKVKSKMFNTEIEAFLYYREKHNVELNKVVDEYEQLLPKSICSLLRSYKIGFDS